MKKTGVATPLTESVFLCVVFYEYHILFICQFIPLFFHFASSTLLKSPYLSSSLYVMSQKIDCATLKKPI